MTEAEEIEQIAREIYESRNGAGAKPWSLRPKAHKAPYLDDARAIYPRITAAYLAGAKDMQERTKMWCEERADVYRNSHSDVVKPEWFTTKAEEATQLAREIAALPLKATP